MQGRAAIEVRLDQARLDGERAIMIGERGRQAVQLLQRDAATGVGLGVVRTQRQGTVEVGQRPFVLA